ncbi:GPO family capsid scaffolding protein [Methylovulum psychrotolerans]|uniref:GPO family capsid scaffolding protein n=1 Tax=Methylovulum psychrotolerans TaxID=1704499 RepID=UPI001474CEB7|nr:GPO family capsid scaffolding protein [Methylovulum psychrotolerans]
MALKTKPFRVARSGNTIDGRKITLEMLTQAVETYNRDSYTALIWPDHLRGYNLGVVDSISLQKNTEGGVDLYAVFEPNDFYRYNNDSGQRLFTSIEVMPNFAGTGKWYFTGLAATDNPASLGTEEVRFSKLPDDKNFYSTFIESNVVVEDDKPPSWFMKFTKHLQIKGDDEMASTEYVELKKLFDAQTVAFTELKESVTKLTGTNPPPPAAGDDVKVTELTAKVTELTTQVAEKDKLLTDFTAKLATLETGFTDISTKLAAALQEQPGTNSPTAGGGGADEFAAYV